VSVAAAHTTRTSRGPGLLFAPWCRQVALAQATIMLAWLVYATIWVQSLGRVAEAKASIWWCMPGMSAAVSSGGSGVTSAVSWLPMWLLMSAAMTFPAVLPAAQHVAANSFRRRRSPAVGVFLGAYLLLWLAFGIAAETALAPLRGGPAYIIFSLALAVAAAYELTPVKRWAVNRCHRTTPLPPSGLPGIASVARFAWINGSGCVASCGPAMLAMLLAPTAQPLAMAAFTVAMSYGRLTRRPRTGRRRVAACYAVVASLFMLVAL
jgi:predicted metal-binding membrane protein